MNIKYWDEETSTELLDFDMILNLVEGERSFVRRTIERLGIEPYCQYKNKFLYKQSDLDKIKVVVEKKSSKQSLINPLLNVVNE